MRMPSDLDIDVASTQCNARREILKTNIDKHFFTLYFTWIFFYLVVGSQKFCGFAVISPRNQAE